MCAETRPPAPLAAHECGRQMSHHTAEKRARRTPRTREEEAHTRETRMARNELQEQYEKTRKDGQENTHTHTYTHNHTHTPHGGGDK